MLGYRTCRVLCRKQTECLFLSRNAFSSKRRDRKVSSEDTLKLPTEEKQWDGHSNWELLALRGYRFFLPGSVGLLPKGTKGVSSNNTHNTGTYKRVPRPKRGPQQFVVLPETNYLRHMEVVTQLAVMSSELNFIKDEKQQPKQFHCQAMECPIILREQVTDLFPLANLGHGPITAVCVALRCCPQNFEQELERLITLFEETARRVCSKLARAGFWADFPSRSLAPDISLGPAAAAQIEAAQQLKSPGLRVTEIAGCVLLLQAALGESKVVGWFFTNALMYDKKLTEILKEENK